MIKLSFEYTAVTSSANERSRRVMWNPQIQPDRSVLWVRSFANKPVGEAAMTALDNLMMRGFVRKLGPDGKSCVWVSPEEARGIDANFDLASVSAMDFARKVCAQYSPSYI